MREEHKNYDEMKVIPAQGKDGQKIEATIAAYKIGDGVQVQIEASGSQMEVMAEMCSMLQSLMEGAFEKIDCPLGLKRSLMDKIVEEAFETIKNRDSGDRKSEIEKLIERYENNNKSDNALLDRIEKLIDKLGKLKKDDE